jgi:hypothetical protein
MVGSSMESLEDFALVGFVEKSIEAYSRHQSVEAIVVSL